MGNNRNFQTGGAVKGLDQEDTIPVLLSPGASETKIQKLNEGISPVIEPPANASYGRDKIAWRNPKNALPLYYQNCWVYLVNERCIFMATYIGNGQWESAKTDIYGKIIESFTYDKSVHAWCDEGEISLPEWNENDTLIK
jgi:hypothetical protein